VLAGFLAMEERSMNGESRGDDSHDPFAVFDASSGVGRVRDPYPTFAALRAQTPVFEGRFDKVFNLPAMPTTMGNANSRFFIALSYDAVSQVLLDGATFSSRGYADTMGS
jgi:cytochrome P450